MLPTLRGEQSGYYQYQLRTNKTQSPQKGLFCPFIILHIIKYVKEIGGIFMPIYKMTDKNGKNIRKDGLQKYRVRINYTDSFGKSHQIDRVAFGAETAKQLEIQLTQKLNAKEIAPKMTIGQLFTEYITAKRSEVRETSLDKSLRILKKNVLPTFESVRIDNLNVPMVQKWKQELSEHYERCKKVVPKFSDDMYICGGERPIRDTSLEKTNKKFADLAGVKRIRIHDFRHSHASLLANEGINIQEIARRLGHSNISMTWNTYSHLYPREEERAVKILNTIV